MPFPSHILMIEDNPSDQALVQHWAQRDWPPTTLTVVSTVEEGMPLLCAGAVDCVLLDMSLTGISGVAAIDQIMHCVPTERQAPPLVIVTGADTRESLVAIRHGAQEWVDKNDPQFREHLLYAIQVSWARYRHWEERYAILRSPLPVSPPRAPEGAP